MSRIIGLNTLFLIPNAVGGTENYTRTFVEGLEKTDTQNTYLVFCNRENFDTFHFSSPRFHKVLCRVSATNRLARIFYEQIIFPFVLQKNLCGVVHSFGYIGPIFAWAKKIVTIHDANWRDESGDISMFSRIILSILMECVTRTSDFIVTDSTFSRSRLVHFYPGLKAKVRVILPWVGEKLTLEFRKLHAHPLKRQDYVLCVSGLYPHKKIPYLLDIIGDKRLVLIGKNGLDESFVRRRVKSMPNVLYHSKVSLPELASYYQHASGLVFPSVYEGFGYPVYEALCVGIPTLVGKKNLYEPEIQAHLTELTFDRAKDIQLVEKLNTRSKRSPIVVDSREKSIQNLISLYESI